MGKKNRKKNRKNRFPNVSIVTPTYNRVEFIKILFKCILNQNYPIDKLEWIIVDGQNNNDLLNELPELKKELKTKSKLKIIYYSLPINENNKLGALRNKTNELSSGDIIVCMDDDDYYPPNRVINAVKGLQYGKLDLAGTSKLFIYDFDLDEVIEFGPFHKNHSTNNGMAYTKTFANKNKYNNTDAYSEEKVFLNNYRYNMIQLDTKDSLLHLSHNLNTINKRHYFESAYINNIKNMTNLYKIFNRKNLNNLIPDDIYQEYLKICLPYKRHSIYSKYDIVYYCGLLTIEWDPNNKKLGGSEQAVLHLSKYWASKGFKVAVYLKTQNECNINNVDFISADKFKASLKYKNIIIWRDCGFKFIVQSNIHIDNLYLDLHDTQPPYLLEKYYHKIDKIFTKSKFHKYATLNMSINEKKLEKKIVNIMNGIRINNFKINKKNVQRNKYRFCYTSCYTRGLLPILEHFFPVLKKIIPEVELHIYYGFPKNKKHKKLNEKLKKLINELDGVYEHGRVGMEEIIEEKYKSNFHLYITNTFAETDCIAIRESLITNCIPIISTSTVFYERDGIKFNLNDKDPNSYIQIAIRISQIIKDTKYCDEIRNKLKFSSTIKSWDEIGYKWLNEMNLVNNSMKNIKKSYLINLEKRPDKLKEFFDNYPYKKNNITVFKAIDGNKIVLNEEIIQFIINYINKNSSNNNKGPIKGELGCTLSHMNIWKLICNNDDLNENDKIAIFEDDAFFTSNFKEVWNEIEFPDDLDFMYIGGRFYDNYLPSNLKDWYNYSKHVYTTNLEDRTTHSYIITKKGANKLLQIIKENNGIHNPIDHWLTEQMVFLNSYTILPLLCWSPPDYKSDIKRSENNYFNISSFHKIFQDLQ